MLQSVLARSAHAVIFVARFDAKRRAARVIDRPGSAPAQRRWLNNIVHSGNTNEYQYSFTYLSHQDDSR